MSTRVFKIDSVIATIIIALIGFTGTTIATIVNNSNANNLEQRKFEYELIKKGFEISDESERVKFLKSLTLLKLVHDEEMAHALNSLIDHPESLPQLNKFIPLEEPIIDSNSTVELRLKRTIKTDSSTIGELSVNGKLFAYSIEDKDRGLQQNDPLERINLIKVPEKTAIPMGRYEVRLLFSKTFQRKYLTILNVPGFKDVTIHIGIDTEDLHGSIALGLKTDGKTLSNSGSAVNLLTYLFDRKKYYETKVFLTIQ